MTRPEHKITLKEVPSPHFMERHARYAVEVNGKKAGDLYYNMTGYVGTLPMHDGMKLSIGERSITGYRKEIRLLNKEAAEAIARGKSDKRVVHDSFPTEDASVVALLSMEAGDDPRISLVYRSAWLAAQRLFGEGKLVGLGFFKEADVQPGSEPAVLLHEGHWVHKGLPKTHPGSAPMDHLPEDHWTKTGLPHVKTRAPEPDEADRLSRYVDQTFATANKDTLLVVSRLAGCDSDPEPFFVSRISLELARARYGGDVKISDLSAAEPEIIPDPADRASILGQFTWFDLDAGTITPEEQRRRFSETALATARAVGERLSVNTPDPS